jgi:M6 family metalloprotease-like protein
MKRQLCLLLTGLLCLIAQAIPADPTPMVVAQPDGSTLTVILHGDEFFHFTTTADGYTVVKDEAGYYTYAVLDGDRLVPSNRPAHDLTSRSGADRAFLNSIPKGLTSQSSVNAGRRMMGQRNAAMRRVGADGTWDYENFKGLIILINYTNKKFMMSDANEFYDDMVNTHDFSGYTFHNRYVRMTGSVRDYFYDNSAHLFDPHFDIVGPVDVNYSSTYPQSTNRADVVFHAALDSVDAMIDFSDYDTDGDGYVDMVFFLVAGFSANYGGNNENYLWPHMYYLYNEPMRDGVNFGLYACSTEIAGWEGYGGEGYYYDVNGIGTFCHEFGHVLGLPDLYDTDYEGSGGESRNPGEWSIMAGGSGNNFGRNPVGYSLYERYALGFSQPVVLNQEGVHELQALDMSNQGYRLNTPNEDEFFLIENRQAGKWDANLPGCGMMIARVDSTNEYIWWYNQVNCDPKHMYYELLRANYIGRDSEYDPFPGAAEVTSITNFTTPNLLTWNKNFNDYAIFDIAEADGLVTFTLKSDTSILSVVEDFENMPVTSNLSAKGVKGVFSKWDFSKCSVVEVEDSTWCNGQRAVAMKKPSMITTSAPLNIIPYSVKYTVYNPTSTDANFRLSYSLDNGETWISPDEGVASADGKSKASATVSLPTNAPIMLRINQTSGNTKVACYLDDIKLYYTETWGPETIAGDVNGDGEVNIADVNAVIDYILGNKGDIAATDVNDDGEVNIADINALIDLILTGN